MRDLPRNLPETFERILSKSTETNDIDLGRKIFRWVSVAKRPLTVEELREAIGIRPLQEAWDDSTYINDMKKAIACCGNLVFIEEEQQTLHFTHSSVKQYLLSSATQESPSKYYVNIEKADEDAGAICVTYLNFPVFNRQVARTTGKILSATGITSTVVGNSLPLGQSGNEIALRLLRSRNQDKKSSKSINRLLEQAAGDTELHRQQQTLRHYSFQPYAIQFWLEHTKQGINPEAKQLWKLWCNLIVEAHWRDTLSGLPWTLDDLKKRAVNVRQWIVEQNHCSLAQLFIGSDKGFDVRLTRQDLLDFVERAAEKGHAHLIAISLGSGLISQLIVDRGLQRAARDGHPDVVERLLQAKADVNATMSGGWTALQVAVKGGHLNVVERLLQANADVDATASVVTFQAAAGRGRLKVVERLLQAKADVNAQRASDGWTALHIAAAVGHVDVVERLLQANADVNATTKPDGKTALQSAATFGYLEIVERLLQANADVDATTSVAILRTAARCGHLGVVERLLQANANLNATSWHDRTALQDAAKSGHLKVVERLLQANADVNATSWGGRTALQDAVASGHEDIAKRLRTAGATE